MKTILFPIIVPNNVCTALTVYNGPVCTDLVVFRGHGVLSSTGQGVESVMNTVGRYPILMSALIDRIMVLAAHPWLKEAMMEDANSSLLIFDLGSDLALCIATLKGQGGVYLLWNKSTGMFYIGSAVRFVTLGYKTGRLTSYFSFKVPDSEIKQYLLKKVSRDLAKQLAKYSIYDFVLIILYTIDEKGDAMKSHVQDIEQFWMLLNPTLNRSLLAKSNTGTQVTPEVVRRQGSTIQVFYQYELLDGVIISKVQIYGIKQLTKDGVVDSAGNVLAIGYPELRASLDNGTVFKDRFVFSPVEHEVGSVINALPPEAAPTTSTTWVYDATTGALHSTMDNRTECCAKYNISRSHLARLTKSHKVYKGFKFYSSWQGESIIYTPL